MHVIQSVTATHDRYLSTPLNSRQTTTEAYHLSRAAALFNQKLSEPVQKRDCDALWATAVVLGVIGFCRIDVSTPEDAWPLKEQPESSSLEWIKMSESKEVIWDITNPARPDSVFHDLGESYMSAFRGHAKQASGIEGIPPEFLELYGLDESSTADNNPYFVAMHVVSRILPMKWDRTLGVAFFAFLHMGPSFKRLLEQKDPRALLILTYWYAKVCHSVWYLERRAILECQATCLYLERYHSGETAILELLQFPKMCCGLLPSV